MDLKTFIKQNREEWASLEGLLKELGKNKRGFSPQSLEDFQSAYRQAAQHLSFSQTYYPREEVTVYLNELVSRAHNFLYRDRVTSLIQIKEFFRKIFIGLLLEQKRFIILATLLFMIGALGGFLSVWNEPLNLYAILPGEIANNIDPGQLGKTTDAIDSPSVSAMIMTNNIQVAFMAFLGGISVGIFTIYLLIFNGIIIGALAAVFLEYGKFYDFWAYIIPHGIIELTAIFIAGGSGLLMGYRILVPGPYPRALQLKRQTLRSVQMLLGTIPLFIIAGIIEGYITPAPISLEAKYGFALFTVLILMLYVWAGSRGTRARDKGTVLLSHPLVPPEISK